MNAGDEISAANLTNLRFDPAAAWNGPTSFAWNGFDGSSYALANGNVDITISATPNTAPMVSDVNKTVDEDNTLMFAPSDFCTGLAWIVALAVGANTNFLISPGGWGIK